jgi:uncharacterized membrane protein YhaH (DUF805 family)
MFRTIHPKYPQQIANTSNISLFFYNRLQKTLIFVLRCIVTFISTLALIYIMLADIDISLCFLLILVLFTTLIYLIDGVYLDCHKWLLIIISFLLFIALNLISEIYIFAAPIIFRNSSHSHLFTYFLSLSLFR